MDVLFKQGHVGVGFDGITVAEDRDRSYSEIFRTGVNLIVDIVRTAHHRLLFRSGYSHEQLRVNDTFDEKRDLLPQTLSYSYSNGGRWSANISTGAAIDAGTWSLDPADLRVFVAGGVHADLFDVRNFILGWSADVSYERDPWRRQFGLTPDTGIIGMYIDVRFDPFYEAGKPK